MARYFFNVADHEFSVRDDSGTECFDQDAALAEALRTLCEVAADQPEKYIHHPLRIEVLDASRDAVLACEIKLTAVDRAKNCLKAAA